MLGHGLRLPALECGVNRQTKAIQDNSKWFDSLRKRIVGDVAKRFHEGVYDEQEKDLFQKVCALYRDAIDASTGVNSKRSLARLLL